MVSDSLPPEGGDIFLKLKCLDSKKQQTLNVFFHFSGIIKQKVEDLNLAIRGQ